MKYTLLGQTGLHVSSLCFGTMSFGTQADDATSAAMFHRCREAGINHFDCADVYGQGKAEEILGRLIAPCRDDVIVATKGYFPVGSDINARGATRFHLKRAVEASLRRLKTDRIDIYYLHRFDDLTPLEESLRALEHLVMQGKILYPAVSNFAAWQVSKALGLAALHRWAPVVCVQPMYNLVKRQAEVELLPMAQAEGVGVFPYGPLGGGLLSGKYSSTNRPAEGRLVDNPMYQVRYEASSNYSTAEAFTQLAREAGHHPASLAIAWVGAHPGVTAPLIGARNLDQLNTCLKAAEIDLSDTMYQAIQALSLTPPPATDRNEEADNPKSSYGVRR